MHQNHRLHEIPINYLTIRFLYKYNTSEPNTVAPDSG